MKALFKNYVLLPMLFLALHISLRAQTPMDEARLGFGKLESYKVEVTYNKTTHLIFASPIRYVDLGSEYLVAGKAEDADNVLRVKAAVDDFKAETNFSVITEDGRFFNFDVFFSPNPATMSYDFSKTGAAAKSGAGDDVLFGELGKNSPYVTAAVMERIHERNRRLINHIGSRSSGILFLLKSIYIHEGKLLFHTELLNNSNLPFAPDFVKFKVVDKRQAKRTVVQEWSLRPLRVYKPLGEVPRKSTASCVFLLDQFTIASDKVLLIELYEKNGARHQSLRIENGDLVRAAVIKKLH